MKMFVGGRWIEKSESIPVVHPYDGRVIDTVPKADLEDVETALKTAVEGAKVMAKMPAYDRYKILRRAAEIMEQRKEELARTITLEEGKPINEGRFEATRAAEIINLSAEEAKRITGETLTLDGAPGVGLNKFGFTVRVPCGVVLAITPFNFSLHLVCHKVGPALAAGNSVIVKPASDTPLSALKLVEILLEAGCPPGFSPLLGFRGPATLTPAS